MAHEIDRQSGVGAVYMRSLMRAQLRLAIVIGAILAIGIGVIPALVALFPAVGRYRCLGVPITWLVLGVGVYPVIIGLAAAYIRRAERNERVFAAMLGDPGDAPGDADTLRGRR